MKQCIKIRKMLDFWIELTMYTHYEGSSHSALLLLLLKISGLKVMAGLEGDQGRWRNSPSDAGEFSKIGKIFLKKSAKLALFSPIFSKKFKSRVKFSRVWTKTQLVGEILRKFRKY